MHRRSIPIPAVWLACALAFATAAVAQEKPHEPDLRNPGEPVPFLLDPALRPQSARILAPAPTPGTPRHAADREVFRETRALRDGPRWRQAIDDVALDVPSMLGNFSCAVGTRLGPVKTPVLAGLLTRVSADAERAIEPAKAANRRERPFVLDQGATCQPKEKLASYDYPSGHATWGWTIGLLLAELAPDRASDILVRARTYAESRVVCGAHNLSAIDAGATNAAALVATLHGSPAFRDALQAARGEIAAVRAVDALAPDRAACAVPPATMPAY
jgi:acid phosphatase (class A)